MTDNKDVQDNNEAAGAVGSNQPQPDARRTPAELVRLVADTASRANMERIEDAVIDAVKSDPERAAELSGFEGEVKRALENTQEAIETIDAESIDRVIRAVKVAKNFDLILSGKTEEVSVEGRNQIKAMLERHQWGRIFTELKKGDRLLSCLVPGADFLSIKNLNELFGESTTDKIINQKRILLKEKLDAQFPGVTILYNEYKVEAIRVPQDVELNPEELEGVMADVDSAMTDYINDLATTIKNKPALKKFLKKLNGSEETGDKKGFRMNYGWTIVTEDTIDAKIGALNRSLQTSSINRGDAEKYGAEYSGQEILAEVDSVATLRTEIMSSGNKITDKNGNEFEIFSKMKDGYGEYLQINIDVLRDVRKGKFEVGDEYKPLLEKIALYAKKVNIFDAVKPFVYAERHLVKKNADKNVGLAAKIEAGENLTDEEKERFVEKLLADERAPQFTSHTEFDRRATGMENAAYLSLDVKDLGVKLKMEYERQLQLVEQEPDPDKRLELFNKLSLSAGDKTTALLRKFWSSVEGVAEKFGLKGENGLITARVGGDELVLAVEIGDEEGRISKSKMSELLFALKNGTNSRVIETVVSQSEKDVKGETDELVLAEAHLSARKRAENGGSILKDIEGAARKLTLLLEQKKINQEEMDLKIDGLSKIFVRKEDRVVANVVVREKDKNLIVVNDDNNEFSVSWVEDGIQKMLKAT